MMMKTIVLLVVIAVGSFLAWEWNVRPGLKQDMLAAFARYDLLAPERYRALLRFIRAYDEAHPGNPTRLAIAAMRSLQKPSVQCASQPLADVEPVCGLRSRALLEHRIDEHGKIRRRDVQQRRPRAEHFVLSRWRIIAANHDHHRDHREPMRCHREKVKRSEGMFIGS